ncbi:MAG: hypothetical protein HYX24_07140 [Candidatus Aenigmarchaeota archaeon]|nr:hypothetical protein [Candidatus Aenigmarchaeota archaeon]
MKKAPDFLNVANKREDTRLGHLHHYLKYYNPSPEQAAEAAMLVQQSFDAAYKDPLKVLEEGYKRHLRRQQLKAD